MATPDDQWDMTQTQAPAASAPPPTTSPTPAAGGSPNDYNAIMQRYMQQLLQQPTLPQPDTTPVTRGLLSRLGEALGGGQTTGVMSPAQSEVAGLRALQHFGTSLIAGSGYHPGQPALGAFATGFEGAAQSERGSEQGAAATLAAQQQYAAGQQQQYLERLKTALPLLQTQAGAQMAGRLPTSLTSGPAVPGTAGGAGTPSGSGLSALAYGQGGPGSTIPVPDEYMPMFEAAAKRNNMPVDLLIAQARQESGFNPNAAGGGLMQIQDKTALSPGFGMQGVRNPAVLKDAKTNIDFGADYLAARAKAAGVDLNTPQGQVVGLQAYNGGGDKDYVQHVTRYMPAPLAPVQTAGPGAPTGGPTTPPAAIPPPTGATPPGPAAAPPAASTAAPATTAVTPPVETPPTPSVAQPPAGSGQRVPDQPPPYVRPPLPPELNAAFHLTPDQEAGFEQQFQEARRQAVLTGNQEPVQAVQAAYNKAKIEQTQKGATALQAFDAAESARQNDNWKTQWGKQQDIDQANATAAATRAQEERMAVINSANTRLNAEATDQGKRNSEIATAYGNARDAAIGVSSALQQGKSLLTSLPGNPASLMNSPAARNVIAGVIGAVDPTLAAKATNADLFEAAMSRAATQMSPKAPAGAERAANVNQYRAALPALANSPEGRELGVNWGLDLAQNQQDSMNWLTMHKEDPAYFNKRLGVPDYDKALIGLQNDPTMKLPSLPPMPPSFDAKAASQSPDFQAATQRYTRSITPGQPFYQWQPGADGRLHAVKNTWTQGNNGTWSVVPGSPP